MTYATAKVRIITPIASNGNWKALLYSGFCWALKTYAAKIPPASWGAKCSQESATPRDPVKIRDMDAAGLNDAPDIEPTVRAPARTTNAMAVP